MKPGLNRQCLVLAVLLAAAGTALAQIDLDPPSTVKPAEVKPDPTAPGPATRSAESVLEDILRQRGDGSTTNPTTGEVAPRATVATPEDAPPVPVHPLEIGPDGLIREGQFLQGRSARLKHDETTGATLVIFENPKGLTPLGTMAAVPSRMLELMENAAGFGDPKNAVDLVFPIDAEVTQYRGKNYLFLGKPAVEVRLPPATVPATMPETVAGILPQPKIQVVAPNAPDMKEIVEGELVEQRVGRFVKDARTGAEIVVFDGDGKRMLDQPMGLIPCRYLAVMEDASEYGMKPVKFKVSGVVTQYRGKNFLLLKSVTVVREIHSGIGG